MTPCNQVTTSSADTNPTTDRSDLEKIERRRAQTRTRQLRYLQKKRQYESDLQTSVESLQAEVRKMQQHRHQLQDTGRAKMGHRQDDSRYTLGASVLHTARAFVHSFRSGFETSEHAPWLPHPAPSQEQTRFVQQFVRSDVHCGELRGQNAFLEQWRRYTTFFGSLTLHPKSFKLLSPNADHVMCQVQLIVSLDLLPASFQNVFPHLLQPRHSTLLNRLENQRIGVPSTFQLQFDAMGRVSSFDWSLNFVAALRPLLSSYEDVATVLQDAHISACGHLGSDIGHVRDARLSLAYVLSPVA